MNKLLILLPLLLASLVSAETYYSGPFKTSAFTRGVATNENAAGWRAALGIAGSGSGTGTNTFDTGQFYIDTLGTVSIKDGAPLTNAFLKSLYAIGTVTLTNANLVANDSTTISNVAKAFNFKVTADANTVARWQDVTNIHNGIGGGGGAGSVSSVGLSAPSALFNSPVSGSPVTTSGVLALTLANQTANRFLAGPAFGASAAPTFRTIDAGDLGAGRLTFGNGLTFYPSNIIVAVATNLGRVTVPQFGHYFTNSVSWPTDMNRGWDLIVADNNGQYRVSERISSTVMMTVQQAEPGYTNGNISYIYPTATDFYDVDGIHVGGIANDGAWFVVNGSFAANHNSGTIQLMNGLHSWSLDLGPWNPAEANEYFSINSFFTPVGGQSIGAGIFKLSDYAHYDSLVVMSNSIVSLYGGLTNFQGPDVSIWGGLAGNTMIYSTVTNLQPVTHRVLNSITNVTGTLSATIDTHLIKLGTTNAGIKLFDNLAVSNETYQVVGISNGTNLTTLQVLLTSYTNAAGGTFKPAQETWQDRNGISVRAVDEGGSMTLAYPRRISFVSNNSSNNWQFGGDSDNSFFLYNQGNAANGAPFRVNPSAGYDSLLVQATGVVNAKYGFGVGAAIGMTTNINVIIAGNTTNQLQFTKGILTGVAPQP